MNIDCITNKRYESNKMRKNVVILDYKYNHICTQMILNITSVSIAPNTVTPVNVYSKTTTNNITYLTNIPITRDVYKRQI